VPELARVCIDANVFIDVFVRPAGRESRLPGSLWVLEAAERGEHQLVVPAHVIAETLCSGPMRPDAARLRADRKANVTRFLAWLRDSRPLVVEVDSLLAQHAGELGQELEIKGPDALVLAAALRARCTVLYSWDDDDLTRHDGHPLLDGLRVVNPTVPPDKLPMQLSLDDADDNAGEDEGEALERLRARYAVEDADIEAAEDAALESDR